MALFDFFTRRFSKKEVKDTLKQSLVPLFAEVFGSGLQAKKNTEYYTSWVATAIRVIAERVATIKLRLVKEDSKGNIEQVAVHPVLDLLKDVNPFMSFFYIMERLSSNIELQGNEYWFLAFDGKKQPVGIYPLMPENITVVPSETEYVKHYIYRVGSKKFEIPKTQIIHFKQFNPASDIIGLGTLEAAKLAAETDMSSASYNNKFFLNSARPDVILTYPDTLPPEQQKRLLDAWNESYSGPDRQFKTAIASGGMEISVLQHSQKDMDYIESRKWNRDEILAKFRVPLSIIGITGISSRAEADAVNAAFMENTIVPKMERIVNTLNEFLLPLYVGTDGVYFEFENPVRKDRDLAIREYQAGIAGGWLSTNDVRRMEDLPEIENGETVYIPFSLQPLGNPSKKKSVENEFAPVAKQLSGFLKEASKLETKESIQEEKDRIFDAKGEAVIKKKEVEGMEYIRRFNKTLSILWEGQKERAINSLNNIVKASGNFNQKAKQPELLNRKLEIKTTMDLFLPLLTGIIEKEGELVAEDFGLEEFEITNELEKFVMANTKKFAGEITETTSNLLRAQIAAGLEQGESILELTKRIEESTAFNSLRAEKIARTETIRAQSQSEIAVWKETGVVRAKVWFTALDERTCENCGPMHGTEIQLDDNFFKQGDVAPGGLLLGYSDTDGPPLHPQCRCTLLPVVNE